MADEKNVVLIVDDNEFFLSQQISCLGRERFDIHTASSGKQAIDKARSVNPDLILLDQIMEDMMGLDVCRILKADPATAHIPVIIVSSGEREASRLQLAAAGFDGIIFKPIRRNQALALVEAFLGIAVRSWARTSVSLPCTAIWEGTGKEGTIHSLGGGGAFISGNITPVKGDMCQIRFSLPDSGAGEREVEVRDALVVWLGELDDTSHQGIGIKFLTIKQDDQEAIDRYVASLLNSAET
ncbi:MAG: response regulator [bacterium]|nr:response regulator [bacterium]